ncbi:MAG: hypothetical protein H7Z19_19505 [Chitinophagaceae bacterium]|nr:hypothetical protein [Rubrivivax sp.]
MASIGAAGGTVTGDDGASVTVPAGVMKQSSTVAISISKNSAGSPVATPGDGFIQVSNVFTITPHGQAFDEPVQVTLPFDASLVRDTDQLVILKAQPLGNWVAHSEVTREGAMATLAVRDFSVFMVVIRTGPRYRPAPTAPAPVPFSFSLAVSGTAPNLTITYTFSGTRPTCVEGDRLETVFMTFTDDSYHEPVLGLPVHRTTRDEQLAVVVPNFSPPAAPLSGTTLTHAVIQPAHSLGGDYGSGTLTTSPYVKGRYTCTSELIAGNAVAAPWTLVSTNEPFLPSNGSGISLLADIADVQSSVGAGVVSRARAQTMESHGLTSLSRWEISRDNGASWAVYKLGAERVTPDTSFYSEAAARAAGLWVIEGDLPAFAGTDNGALLRFSACTAIPALFGSGRPPTYPCATGVPHVISVAFLAQPPSFTAMPLPMVVVAGAGASFSAVAAGLPTPTLQWRRRVPGGAWVDITGATGPTYQLSGSNASHDGTQYQVVATNASGSATSAPATLNVVDQAAAPAIAALSGSLTVVEGGAAVFAATVRGTEPMSFQWRRNGVDVLGANAPILRLDAATQAQAGSYVLHVGNPAGSAQGATQQLGVVAAGTALPTAPSIITQPVAVRVNAGNTATFAVGTGGSGPQAYQWRRDNVDIVGATSAFHSIAAASPGDAASYSVVVSNGAGSVTSASVALTVDASVQPTAPTITAQPGAVVVAPGMSATLGVGVQGSGPMSFEWFRDGTRLPGQTQATYTLAAAGALDVGNYQVRVSNGVGEVTSAVAPVILLGAPAIATQPGNRSVTEGATTTFSVTASGDFPRYQWTRNQVAIAGATGPTYTSGALTLADSGAGYGVIVYNGAGLVISQSAVLTVTAAPVAMQWQQPQPLRNGDGYGAGTPVVAAGGAGEFVAAWLDSNETGTKEMRASRYRPGEGWSYPDTVASVSSNSGATMGHAIAMDAAGNAVLVFTSQSNFRQSIWASRQGTTGGWSAPTLIETQDEGQAEMPAVTIDDLGTATAVWQQNDTIYFPNLLATRRIVASQSVVDQGWNGPVDIDFVSGGNGTGLKIHVAASPNGNVVAAWTGDTTAGQVAAANVLRRGVGWIGAQQLVSGTTPTTASVVGGAAVNDAGLALVIFRRLPSTTSNVYAARYTTASGWAAPELLGPNGDAARVVLGPDGTATVAYENSPAGNQILVTRASASGGWSTPQVAGGGYSPGIGRDAGGNVTLAWLSNPGVRSVSSARWPASGPLGSASVIESAPETLTGWVAGGLAVSANGQAAAVWTEGASLDSMPWANVYR